MMRNLHGPLWDEMLGPGPVMFDAVMALCYREIFAQWRDADRELSRWEDDGGAL